MDFLLRWGTLGCLCSREKWKHSLNATRAEKGGQAGRECWLGMDLLGELGSSHTSHTTAQDKCWIGSQQRGIQCPGSAVICVHKASKIIKQSHCVGDQLLEPQGLDNWGVLYCCFLLDQQSFNIYTIFLWQLSSRNWILHKLSQKLISSLLVLNEKKQCKKIVFYTCTFEMKLCGF